MYEVVVDEGSFNLMVRFGTEILVDARAKHRQVPWPWHSMAV